MHEFSIAQNILGIVLAEAERNEGKKVKSIYLKLGEKSHIEPESLLFCLEVVSKGTIAEEAKVYIERIKGKEFHLDAIEIE